MTPDDAELFRQAIGAVTPLAVKPKVAPLKPEVKPIPAQHLADEQRALHQSLSDDFSPESLLDSDAELSWQRAPMGTDVVRKLRRGQWVIQDELDLHGARSHEARELLSWFLQQALKRGLRCVRVIHGKGHGSVNRQPVLKLKVPHWLMQHDAVLAYCQARPADGGAGALLVLLRAGTR